MDLLGRRRATTEEPCTTGGIKQEYLWELQGNGLNRPPGLFCDNSGRALFIFIEQEETI